MHSFPEGLPCAARRTAQSPWGSEPASALSRASPRDESLAESTLARRSASRELSSSQAGLRAEEELPGARAAGRARPAQGPGPAPLPRSAPAASPWSSAVAAGAQASARLPPLPGAFPHTRIEPKSPALQADSLLSEPPRKPMRQGANLPICSLLSVR